MTIIAAAGNDPRYGLPGVSREVIENLPFTRLNDWHKKTALIHNFRWASRAWTFQEDYLSQRKLFFTDAGLVYICHTKIHSMITSYKPRKLRDNNVTWDFLHHLHSYKKGARSASRSRREATNCALDSEDIREEPYRIIENYSP